MLNNISWEMSRLSLPLRFTWRISRNSSDHKTNFVIRISDQEFSGMGEVAHNIRYGETLELIETQFKQVLSILPKELISPTEIQHILEKEEVCNSLKFGICSAYMHYASRKTKLPVAQILGLPEVTRTATCFSLPILPVSEIRNFIIENDLLRFKRLKVKVQKEHAFETISEVLKLADKPLLIDGNEAWENPDEVLELFQKFPADSIEFIEQPLPAALEKEYRHLKKNSPFALFADESVTDNTDFNQLASQFNGVNIKLMKSGSFLKAVQQLRNAKEAGLKTMVGCMIESSLGISCAMHITPLADFTDLDGFLMLQKDPFGLVEERKGELFLV